METPREDEQATVNQVPILEYKVTLGGMSAKKPLLTYLSNSEKKDGHERLDRV